MTPNLDFKVTIFCNVIYLENGTEIAALFIQHLISLKQYKIGSQLLRKANRNTYVIYGVVQFPMTLT